MPYRITLRLIAPYLRLAAVVLLSGASLLLPAVVGDSFNIAISDKQYSAIGAKYKELGRNRVAGWVQLVNTSQGKSTREKLVLVNDFFNQNVIWVSDYDHYGAEDYWATPLETIASGGGDCEDFSIAKYFTLIALNVPMEKLTITYVKADTPNPINRSHMVMTYYEKPASVPLVLDNLNPEIKPASERKDLAPVYTFNGQGLWMAKERAAGKSGSSSASNIALWRQMTSRMGKEFE
jgi:predicted transglutaminase-like cysteine proteinase